MFVTKKRFTQKKGEEHYPVSSHYKHLGAVVNGKGSLTKHYKPTMMNIVRTATALAKVRNDNTAPGKLIRLFITISKATLDYTGPILDSQKETLKRKFSKLSYKALRIILGSGSRRQYQYYTKYAGTLGKSGEGGISTTLWAQTEKMT